MIFKMKCKYLFLMSLIFIFPTLTYHCDSTTIFVPSLGINVHINSATPLTYQGSDELCYSKFAN